MTTTNINPNSIRQTILRMLADGRTTKEIEVVLKEKFPTSAAAAKSVRHIAWYRAQVKKAAKGGKAAVAAVERAHNGNGFTVPEPVKVDGAESAAAALAKAAEIDARLNG